MQNNEEGLNFVTSPPYKVYNSSEKSADEEEALRKLEAITRVQKNSLLLQFIKEEKNDRNSKL